MKKSLFIVIISLLTVVAVVNVIAYLVTKDSHVKEWLSQSNKLDSLTKVVNNEIKNHPIHARYEHIESQHNRDLAIRLLSREEWVVVDEYTVKPKETSPKEDWVNIGYPMLPLAGESYIMHVKENSRVKFVIPPRESRDTYDKMGYDYYVCGGICICLYVCGPPEV